MRGIAGLTMLAGLNAAVQAFVNVEDFTVQPYHRVLTGTQSDSRQFTGLDQSHSLFGKRGWILDITSNPEQAELVFDIGGGEQKLETTSSNLTYRMDLLLGVSGNVFVDFSNEDRILIDLHTAPDGVFADVWNLTVSDANGVSRGNGFWLLRPGGIYFRKQDFGQGLDWSKIRSIEFAEYQSQPQNPLLYSVTRMYATPEPTPCLTAGCLAFLIYRRRARRVGA